MSHRQVCDHCPARAEVRAARAMVSEQRARVRTIFKLQATIAQFETYLAGLTDPQPLADWRTLMGMRAALETRQVDLGAPTDEVKLIIAGVTKRLEHADEIARTIGQLTWCQGPRVVDKITGLPVIDVAAEDLAARPAELGEQYDGYYVVCPAFALGLMQAGYRLKFDDEWPIGQSGAAPMPEGK